MKMKNELGWRTRPSSSTKDHVPAVQTDLAVLPHEHAQFRPYSPESTNNAETTWVWGMWERAHQYNLPHENVRQTEMSLKDNSGLRYRGKKNGIKAKQWPASVEWALCREFYFVLYARNLDPALCVKQEPALWRGADQDHSHYCAGSQTSEAYHQAQ